MVYFTSIQGKVRAVCCQGCSNSLGLNLSDERQPGFLVMNSFLRGMRTHTRAPLDGCE